MRSRSMLILLILFFSLAVQSNSPTITIASKRYAENYILGEIFAQLLEDRGHKVQRKFGMGGTMIAYNALKGGEVDLYPDYTGTITKAILKIKETDFDKINLALAKDNISMLKPLGFDNSYCMVMKQDRATKLNIKSIDDLTNHPNLVGALSFEFQGRDDGWDNLKKIYSLKNTVLGIEIPLTYEALKNNKVDFAEAYSTEPMIKRYGFVVLEDSKQFFPKYEAIALVNNNLPESIKKELRLLSGRISNQTIIDLNAMAVDGINIQTIANKFLIENKFIDIKNKKVFTQGIQWTKLFIRTKTHIYLAGLAVLLATLVAVPLATLISGRKKLSRFVLGFTGVLQTIPSIALLTFMIPFFGIGFKPAIIGLFIYSLLPILRNTHIAMTGIDPRLITAAKGIGLYPHEVLFSVKLPLAFPTILAGIRTATTLNIGTATLAAFIGAGGLGEPIVTGLALNDSSLVLQGAIPAALLAIVVDGFFSLTEKLFTKNI